MRQQETEGQEDQLKAPAPTANLSSNAYPSKQSPIEEGAQQLDEEKDLVKKEPKVAPEEDPHMVHNSLKERKKKKKHRKEKPQEFEGGEEEEGGASDEHRAQRKQKKKRQQSDEKLKSTSKRSMDRAKSGSGMVDEDFRSTLKKPNGKKTCVGNYLAVLQVYNRVVSNFFQESKQLPRPIKVLSNLSQFLLILMLTGILVNGVSLRF